MKMLRIFVPGLIIKLVTCLVWNVVSIYPMNPSNSTGQINVWCIYNFQEKNIMSDSFSCCCDQSFAQKLFCKNDGGFCRKQFWKGSLDTKVT